MLQYMMKLSCFTKFFKYYDKDWCPKKEACLPQAVKVIETT